MSRPRLIINALRCKRCNVILQSFHGHDFKMCACSPPVGVDGGLDYVRRIGNEEHYEELSVWDDTKKSDEHIKK